MPKSVVWFERLTYGSLVIDVAVLAITSPQSRLPAATFVLLIPATLMIYGLTIWLIARRRKNWARWLYVVCSIAGMPFFVHDRILGDFRKSILMAVLSSVELTMQAVAIALLFTASSRSWFSQGGVQTESVITE